MTPDEARLRQLRQLRRAKDLMDREWDQLTGVAEVARHAGYSRAYFIRAFRATYGETPGHYLSRRRVERARDLLRTDDGTVTDICVRVGFHSLGTFSATFKRHTGWTPSEYRRRYRGRGETAIPGCYALLWVGGIGARRPPPDAGRRPPAAPVSGEGTSEEAGDGPTCLP